jgi:CheY-like chemotaxis protein
VNARDAIADVGRVTIETDLVSFDESSCTSHAGCTPGEYVLLGVSDTGCGMDKGTLNHIFEPFFTTKAVGEGTGLGLATVYGIVKQNNGFIGVYSEPGQGTTFKIYFPRHTAKGQALRTLDEDVPQSKGETLLVVEDDPILLEMGKQMLQRLGYRVLSAETPGKALSLAKESHNEIDLFLTDVVMPEMNGRDLAEQLQKVRPGIKHLFMSGYTTNIIAHQGILDRDINFIQKPFSLKDLAAKLREVLDQRPAGKEENPP